ncbi:serine/threonine protein phosphatase [Luteimonas sp. Y-2-2-4F]|nr:serine/threonine protein phosphatase [Luteimonas sp. Y-2-2-4F]MCD9031068.1 serine/threonine protein phosphatase [Luteimonas sp. Y-2-2-4F]
MIEPIRIAGETAWLKRYPSGGGRRLRLAALDCVARRLGLQPLRPPPHRSGADARAVEQRRIQQLQTAGVRVPEILGSGRDVLVLSDLGPTLSSRMREAADAPARLDTLTGAAVGAIGAGHARGGYFGQPWPRNLTAGDAGIGFLDFEEDPLDVMLLADAQARDWVLFAYGAARYYGDRPQALAGMLHEALAQAPAEVAAAVGQVGERLRPWARIAGGFRAKAAPGSTIARAISVLHTAAPLLLALAMLLGFDLLHDGELDLFDLLS